MAAVSIEAGEFKTAENVEEGYPLALVVQSWQRKATDLPDDCSWLIKAIEETDRLRIWEKNVGGFTYESRDEFLQQKVLIDYQLTIDQTRELVAAIKRGDNPNVQAVLASDKKTQAEIAAEVGISQGRVSQIINPGTNNGPKQRGIRMELSAGTDPTSAAERIRERLGNEFAAKLKEAL